MKSEQPNLRRPERDPPEPPADSTSPRIQRSGMAEVVRYREEKAEHESTRISTNLHEWFVKIRVNSCRFVFLFFAQRDWMFRSERSRQSRTELVY